MPFLGKSYREILELVAEAQRQNLSCVLVFRPNFTAEENDGGEDCPDMIVSSSKDPAVISALLGTGEDEANDE